MSDDAIRILDRLYFDYTYFIINTMNFNSSGYRIYLDYDLRWTIYADKRLEEWLNRMAGIMELKRIDNVDGNHRIFCVSMNSDNEHASNLYKSQDWQTVYDHPTMRILHNRGMGDYVCEIDNEKGEEIEYINMWNMLYAIYQPVIDRGGLPFHAGLVELDGKGILIAGKSGQGKSTTCRRLSEYWTALCDDETLILFDKENGYMAHPFPTWSDYLWKPSENRWNVDHSVILSAIFFIEQSETDEVMPVETQAESAVLINKSAVEIYQKFLVRFERERKWNAATMVFDNACKMAKTVPAYKLRISLTGRFWEKMEEVIKP